MPTPDPGPHQYFFSVLMRIEKVSGPTILATQNIQPSSDQLNLPTLALYFAAQVNCSRLKAHH